MFNEHEEKKKNDVSPTFTVCYYVTFCRLLLKISRLTTEPYASFYRRFSAFRGARTIVKIIFEVTVYEHRDIIADFQH